MKKLRRGRFFVPQNANPFAPAKLPGTAQSPGFLNDSSVTRHLPRAANAQTVLG